MPGIGIEHAKEKTVFVRQHFTTGGHMSRHAEHQPANGLDFGFLFRVCQNGADIALEFFHRAAGIHIERAILTGGDHDGGRLVMLVGNIAHNGFDQVFNRHQTVNAAIFVNNKGHVRLALAHLQQQVQHGQLRGNKQGLAQQGFKAERLAGAT